MKEHKWFGEFLNQNIGGNVSIKNESIVASWKFTSCNLCFYYIPYSPYPTSENGFLIKKALNSWGEDSSRKETLWLVKRCNIIYNLFLLPF